MPIQTRAQAIATLAEGQARLDELLARLPDDELTRPATIGGGDWSAKDLLGHIAFWEEMALETLADWRAGRQPLVEGIAGDADVDAINARNQARTAEQSPREVRARAAAAHGAVLEAIRALSDEEWRAAPTYANARKASLAELLGSVLSAEDRPFGHAFDHLRDLRAFVESLGRRR